MNKFLVKISILPPNAKNKTLPCIEKSEVIFICSNILIKDAINLIYEQEVYKKFNKSHNNITEYIYFTDVNGDWHHYDESIDI